MLLIAAAQAPEDRAANDALGAELSPRWTLLRDPMELRRAVETYDGSLLQAGLSLIGQAATETVDGRGELVNATLDVTGAGTSAFASSRTGGGGAGRLAADA